ncbi:MAG: hypothetical protein RJA07_2731 [Bacteroidota bacterium]|jgi:hypothetical protein
MVRKLEDEKMNFIEKYRELSSQVIGENRIINSLDDAIKIGNAFNNLRNVIVQYFLKESWIKVIFVPHYRGEQNHKWNIENGICRGLNISSEEAKALEKKAILKFEEIVKEEIGEIALRNVFNNLKYGKEWDLLFQAQHAGVKTTLVDFTVFIKVALFFAVQESEKIENSVAQLWVFMIPEKNIFGDNANLKDDVFLNYLDPFNVSNDFIVSTSSYLDDIINRPFDLRRNKQGGSFFVSNNESISIALNKRKDLEPFIYRFTIPQDKKKEIRKQLKDTGIDEAFLEIIKDEKLDAIAKKVNELIYQK